MQRPYHHVMCVYGEKGHHAELVRARLCHREDRLVYVLTLLGRSGRVFSETVAAANGEVIGGR